MDLIFCDSVFVWLKNEDGVPSLFEQLLSLWISFSKWKSVKLLIVVQTISLEDQLIPPSDFKVIAWSIVRLKQYLFENLAFFGGEKITGILDTGKWKAYLSCGPLWRGVEYCTTMRTVFASRNELYGITTSAVAQKKLYILRPYSYKRFVHMIIIKHGVGDVRCLFWKHLMSVLISWLEREKGQWLD